MSQPARSLFEQSEPAPAKHSELRLLRLHLRHFKGIKELTLEPGGANLEIRGDNATGKTTLFDAFCWLLWSKDSLNRTDFEIKTLDPDGQALHGLEHEVEGVFSLGGRQLTLRKIYTEKWVKQRGSAERVFSGHETLYHVDGVPVRKQDYDGRVAAIVDEKTFRLLSDPAAFNEQLHWTERRKLLLEVCGDITDREVIASDPALFPLNEILGSRSLDDHRKVLQASRTKINRELEQIPVRISEVQRGLPETGGLDAAEVARTLEAARAARQTKLEQLALAEQGGGAAPLQDRLAAITRRLLDIETAYRKRADDVWLEQRRKAQDAALAVSGAERELMGAREQLSDVEQRAQRLAERLEALRATFRDVSAEEFTHVDQTVCPTCGQPLPEEMVAEARAKAQEQWNLARAERTESINREGRDLRMRKDQADAAAAEMRKRTAELESKLSVLRQRAAQAAAEPDGAGQSPDPGADPEYRRLALERDRLTAEIAQLRAGGQAKTMELRTEVSGLEQQVASAERVISQVEQHARGLARIEELRAEEKRLAREYEDLERQLHLTEEFVRTKVRLLTEQINSRFEHARFKLFNVLVNGAVEECCDTTYRGVPWPSLNHGAQINVGLDILNTLSAHFGFRAPVWVDRAESVTRLIPVEAQLIRLVVSEADKALRIERSE